MAIQQNDPRGSNLSDDEILRRRATQFDNEIPDPVMDREPASGGRLALFAIAFIAILGVVFYGLNNSSTQQTSPTAQTQTSPMRAPGQTTGSATTPAQPSPPAAVQPSSPAPAAPGAPASPPAKN